MPLRGARVNSLEFSSFLVVLSPVYIRKRRAFPPSYICITKEAPSALPLLSPTKVLRISQGLPPPPPPLPCPGRYRVAGGR